VARGTLIDDLKTPLYLLARRQVAPPVAARRRYNTSARCDVGHVTKPAGGGGGGAVSVAAGNETPPPRRGPSVDRYITRRDATQTVLLSGADFPGPARPGPIWRKLRV